MIKTKSEAISRDIEKLGLFSFQVIIEKRLFYAFWNIYQMTISQLDMSK